MSKNEIVWSYGENEFQIYYDAKVGNDYLLVFANKSFPNIWYGLYNNILIFNKTKNDRQRKKEDLPRGCRLTRLRSQYVLCSTDPEYMKKKVVWCYTHKLNEISQ